MSDQIIFDVDGLIEAQIRQRDKDYAKVCCQNLLNYAYGKGLLCDNPDVYKRQVLIGLQESAESSVILDGIKNYLNNFESSDDEEITDRAYELGSLLGNTIQKHYGWNWFCVEENTDDSFHCVASNKERACCACHEYIYSILTKQHSNNVKLLFNMINKDYPKEWNFMLLS